MTLHSRRLFTLCSHLDHVSILAAEFTVTISDNNTVHSTKDCIADTRCASLYNGRLYCGMQCLPSWQLIMDA